MYMKAIPVLTNYRTEIVWITPPKCPIFIVSTSKASKNAHWEYTMAAQFSTHKLLDRDHAALLDVQASSARPPNLPTSAGTKFLHKTGSQTYPTTTTFNVGILPNPAIALTNCTQNSKDDRGRLEEIFWEKRGCKKRANLHDCARDIAKRLKTNSWMNWKQTLRLVTAVKFSDRLCWCKPCQSVGCVVCIHVRMQM